MSNTEHEDDPMRNTSRTAERLKYAMNQHGMSAAELSRRSECNKSSISMYLQGEHTASKRNAEKLGRTLGVNPAWLMGYDVPMSEEETTRDPIRVMDISRRRFLQVGDTMINLEHVITITQNQQGDVSVLLDTGTTVEGAIIE